MNIGEEIGDMPRVDSCPLMDISGNCVPFGRFCTPIDDEICNGLKLAYKQGRHDGVEQYLREREEDEEWEY